MNLRRKKEPDPLAPPEAVRITGSQPTKRRPPRKAPVKQAPQPEQPVHGYEKPAETNIVYPPEPQDQYTDIRMDFKLPQFGVRSRNPAPQYTAEKPDRDYIALAMDICIALIAVALVGVGMLLTTQPGTPNNLAWIHAENGLIGILLVLMYIRKK